MSNVHMNEVNGWEHGWSTYIEGLDTKNETLINKGLHIMNTIDPEFTATITEDNSVTVYHGTHEDNLTFVDREVKSYDSIGTWFTSNKEYASMLYGKNAITSTVTLNNPLVVSNVIDLESFDRVFYNSTLTTKSFDQIESLLLNTKYMNEFKQDLTNKGYDGIIFKDSRIDVFDNEVPHTVYIVFHVNSIKQIN